MKTQSKLSFRPLALLVTSIGIGFIREITAYAMSIKISCPGCSLYIIS